MSGNTTQRWLVASVVLNLFLAGGIAGGAWRWWNTQATPGATATTTAQPRGLRYAADDLAPEQRQAYRAGLREARREAATAIQAARAGRQEIMQLLVAPQFNRAAAAAALARVREADTAARVRFEASVIEFASTLSPVERERLALGLARSRLAPPRPQEAQ